MGSKSLRSTMDLALAGVWQMSVVLAAHRPHSNPTRWSPSRRTVFHAAAECHKRKAVLEEASKWGPLSFKVNWPLLGGRAGKKAFMEAKRTEISDRVWSTNGVKFCLRCYESTIELGTWKSLVILTRFGDMVGTKVQRGMSWSVWAAITIP